jgi:hypothetical protein
MCCRYFYFYVVFAIGMSACSGVPKKSEEFTPNPETVAESIMRGYQDAFTTFWNTYDKSLSEVFEPYRGTYEKIGWARVDLNSNTVAMTSGQPVAFFTIYTPGHALLDNWFPTYQARELNGWPVIMIRPDQISKSWAPIFLIHEMSHLTVMLNKTPIDLDTDEVMAYSLEKLALNALTQYQADKGLDDILSKLGIKTEKQLLDIKQESVVPLFVALDKTLFVDLPASKAEAEMRFGLYHLALGFRFFERQKLTAKLQEKRMRTFWKQYRERYAKPYDRE